MIEWFAEVAGLLTVEQVLTWVRSLLLLVAGFLVAKIVSKALYRVLQMRLERQQALLLQKSSFYLLVILFTVAALHQLGFNLGVLLGAAGILTVAIGFASQTSASNIISGLFLIAERPFAVGDVIQVGGTTGEVLSIDLLSVKLRTFDNLFVRVPNENLIKSEIRTLTKFPIRRLDLQIGVAYKENLSRVRSVLNEVADKNTLSLQNPAPLFILQGFGDSSIDIQFSVWAKRENYLAMKTAITENIKVAFDKAGIEIPFPQRVVYMQAPVQPSPAQDTPQENPDLQDPV